MECVVCGKEIDYSNKNHKCKDTQHLNRSEAARKSYGNLVEETGHGIRPYNYSTRLAHGNMILNMSEID